MKNKTKRILISFISVLLACVMFFTTACSCAPNDVGNNPPTSSDSSVLDGDDNNTSVKPSNPDDTDLEDYELNEAENFVYSLIYSDLKKQYDTFTGYVSLQSNARSTETVEVYGISYVDYEEGYIDESGKTYFSAGFISFPGEPVINQSNIDSGLEIVSLEEEYDELFSYVYTYTTEDVHMHCVIDNKYVKYDVVDGVIQYEEEPYVKGMDVDFTRGNIYSYDIEDYIYIVEEQDYVPVSGVSLLGEADYRDIMDEVNRILQTQEANLTYAEIESYVSQSQDALYSYLLGLQEETFMGIPTADLVSIVRDLDPMQHLQIGVDANGSTTIDIIEVTKLPSLWEKIATSLVCAFGTVGGFVCSAIGCPVIGGALIGASMEAFAQVVINNTPVSDIQWAQVAVAAVSGAIAGGVSGAINGIATKGVGQVIMKEVADTFCDSVIGGGEFFVNSLIAGYSFEEACKNFGYGVIAGAVISGGIKIGSAAIKGGAKLIKKATTSTVSDVGGKQLTKLGNEAAEDSISELQEKAMQKSAKNGAEDALTRSGDDIVNDPKFASNIRKETGWASNIISNIDNMDQYSILKNADLIEVQINGKKCLIKNNIDWDFVDEDGISNKSRVSRGLAPLDSKTGKPIELHHLGQKADSPLVELTVEEHRTGYYKDGQKNQSLWHDNTIESEVHGEGNSWYQERKAHWKSRAEDIKE